MGIANIIPGVSGGIMAVSLGIYDDMIHALKHLMKEFKKSLTFLLPIGIGAVIGIIGLVLASPIAILLNTNAIGHLQTGNTLILLPIGLVSCLVCFFLTYYIGTKEDLT